MIQEEEGGQRRRLRERKRWAGRWGEVSVRQDVGRRWTEMSAMLGRM
jgi:hypothetical protein